MTFDKTTLDLLNLPSNELHKLNDGDTAKHMELSRELDAIATKAAELSAYLSTLHAGTHTAERRAAGAVVKVRRALGYTRP